MTSSAIRTLAGAAAMVTLCAISAAGEPLFKGDESVPRDAIVLFDGKDLSQQFVMCGSDKAPTWKIENGYCQPQGGDICSKQLFNDCQLHVEFWVPYMPNATGQARGNSGVFFMGFTYEIQILDSYELKPGAGDCGAIYSYTPPMVNACRPPEQWQSYDMVFHAPRFDAEGKKTANARITVLQNGVLIHDNAEFPGPTPNHSAADPKGPGPIQLQDHGYPVRFRNVWVRPLSEAK
jgi:hypothetical protein